MNGCRRVFSLLLCCGLVAACTSRGSVPAVLRGGPTVTQTVDQPVNQALIPMVSQTVSSTVASPDLLPYDENAAGDLLAGSSRQGYIVFRRGADGRFEPHHSFRTGNELPTGLLYGEAVFAVDGASIFAAGLGRGLVHLTADGVHLLTMEEGLRGRDIWHVWRHPASGQLWLVYRPLPLPNARGGIHRFDGLREVSFTALGEGAYATINDLLHHPQRGTVFTAGVAGVLEFDAEGRFERRSTQPAAALAMDPASGSMVAVGGAVERWDGERFQPVFFQIVDPRHPPGTFALASALDIAIDRRGEWFILYPEGHLLQLSPAGMFRRLFQPEEGIPPSAQRLLYLRVSDQLAIGSTHHGMVLMALGKG